MAVFRVEHNKNYSTLSNYHFNDKTLTWKAKGLLSNMLSLPPDWDYSLAGLTTLAKDGATATSSALKELEEHGYLIRKPLREKGKIVDWEYTIFEYPHTGKPLVENPKVVKPNMENHTQLNTNISNTELLNTNNKKKERTTYDEIINASGFDEKVQQSLYEFIKMRKLIKKPMTDRALTNIVSRLKWLSKGDNETADKILNQSIENAWQGIYELKADKQEKEDTGQNGNELWNELVSAVNVIKTTLVQEYAGSPYRTPLYELKDKSRCQPIYNKLPFEVKQVVDFGTFVLYGGLDERSMLVERGRFLKAIINR